MINKIKKLIATMKFEISQKKRFKRTLNQNVFEDMNESAGELLIVAITTLIICAICFCMIIYALDARASKFDKKLEQQQFYNIIKATHNQ